MAADHRLLAWLLPVALLAGCESNNRPSPSPSPGGPNGETINGSERIGWDQQASSTAELSSLRYAIYVDGVRSEMADTNCSTNRGTAGFPCSGRLPAMSPGAHSIEIASFTTSGGLVESPRSAPLRVTVAGATAPIASTPLQNGEQIATGRGTALVAQHIAEGLSEPNDIAITPDGRIFVAEASGRLRLITADGISDALIVPESAQTGGIRSIALAPDFDRSAHVFTLQSVASDSGPGVFRIARYRLQGATLVERMVVMRDVLASRDAAGAVRFGPDGKLYAALDDGGSPDLAASLSEWNGKILRINPDGTTPDDQPAASPVFWGGLRAPAGMGWAREGDMLWIAELGSDGVERLKAVGASDERPRRTDQRATYVMPRPLGAGPMAVYTGTDAPELTGDLFVAAREGGYLLRVIFDEANRRKAVRTERMLEQRLGAVRAVAVHDGALFVASNDALWRLTSAPPQRPGSR